MAATIPEIEPIQIGPLAAQVIADLNPWWVNGRMKKVPPGYRRRGVTEMTHRILRPKGLIEVVRGPRQVGKTTAIEQIIHDLLAKGTNPRDIIFLRFDQEVLRSIAGGFLAIIRWYEREIRKRKLERGAITYVFLDEVHKLSNWDEDVKHLFDTFRSRILLTGSSSVLVSKGGRESLAGRVITTDMPTFQFREVLEAWMKIARVLPPIHKFDEFFSISDPRELFEDFRTLQNQQTFSLRRKLEQYYNRGGYPRLYNGEVHDDEWADYLTSTIFERVLGLDIPDLFPVRNAKLLRWVYIEVARSTGQEIKQSRLAEFASASGFETSQPLIGNYLHYLADALLIREFRRYPLLQRTSSRTPAKITLTDLGARNAVFRGAPSLWESSPEHVGPLIETLAQSVIRGPNLQVHFFREHEKKKNRNSPIIEVDFIAEDTAGSVVPIEIKFRKTISQGYFRGLALFIQRYKAPFGIMVTRDTYQWHEHERILCVPLLDFLCAF
jgi:predicted AAA+ superfamily ATPase